MKRSAVLIGLLLCVGLWAVAQQCPPLGLPVTRVDPLGPGGYLIWIQNTAKCAYNEFRIVFHVPVTTLKAVAVGGTAVESIMPEKGPTQVWTVKLAGAGVAPNMFLLLSVGGVSPAVPAQCGALVRAVFPAPLCK